MKKVAIIWVQKDQSRASVWITLPLLSRWRPLSLTCFLLPAQKLVFSPEQQSNYGKNCGKSCISPTQCCLGIYLFIDWLIYHTSITLCGRRCCFSFSCSRWNCAAGSDLVHSFSLKQMLKCLTSDRSFKVSVTVLPQPDKNLLTWCSYS